MSAAKPKNVVLYITDEQRQDCVGAYGNDVIKTPHMDSLAASGIRFNGFFSQISKFRFVHYSLSRLRMISFT